MDKVKWDKAKLKKFIPQALRELILRKLSGRDIAKRLEELGFEVSVPHIISKISNNTNEFKLSLIKEKLLADGLLLLFKSDFKLDYDFDLEEFVLFKEADLEEAAITDFSKDIFSRRKNASEREEQRSLFSGLLALAKEQNLATDHPNWVDFNDAVAKEETNLNERRSFV